MSFLEMMDVLNEKIIDEDGDPVAFDHDCREGICGSCSMFINGEPHGPDKLITTCQLHMRRFKDGDTIYIEPFRARAFPIIKDLVVDRTAFDRIQQSGGFISIRCQAINIICNNSGDVNGDDATNVLDVVAIVSNIVSGNNYYNECADLIDDGALNVLDVVAIVASIINQYLSACNRCVLVLLFLVY